MVANKEQMNKGRSLKQGFEKQYVRNESCKDCSGDQNSCKTSTGGAQVVTLKCHHMQIGDGTGFVGGTHLT